MQAGTGLKKKEKKKNPIVYLCSKKTKSIIQYNQEKIMEDEQRVEIKKKLKHLEYSI